MPLRHVIDDRSQEFDEVHIRKGIPFGLNVEKSTPRIRVLENEFGRNTLIYAETHNVPIREKDIPLDTTDLTFDMGGANHNSYPDIWLQAEHYAGMRDFIHARQTKNPVNTYFLDFSSFGRDGERVDVNSIVDWTILMVAAGIGMLLIKDSMTTNKKSETPTPIESRRSMIKRALAGVGGAYLAEPILGLGARYASSRSGIGEAESAAWGKASLACHPHSLVAQQLRDATLAYKVRSLMEVLSAERNTEVKFTTILGPMHLQYEGWMQEPLEKIESFLAHRRALILGSMYPLTFYGGVAFRNIPEYPGSWESSYLSFPALEKMFKENNGVA